METVLRMRVPGQENLKLLGHAIQCRITAEDPFNRFIPDYGQISAYRGAAGLGIRLDGGTAYTGAVITRFYDPLLEKVTVWGPTREVAISRMRRVLYEFRIRGVATNIVFLERLMSHSLFVKGQITTRFIEDDPDLLNFSPPQDKEDLLLHYIADITINGHPEVKDRNKPAAYARKPSVPESIFC